MNMIDKLIDSRPIADQTINRSENPFTNLPDFRTWSESLMGSPANFFPGNMFPITPSQLSRSLKLSTSNGFDLIPGTLTKEAETDKTVDEEDYCEKCQKKFCNKYYLKRHKLEVHKLEFEMENSLENFQLLNDSQQKSPLLRQSIFNPLLNSTFSNFFLQKSMVPMFANMLLPPSSIPQSSQLNSEFNTTTASILSPSAFRSSQACPGMNAVDLLSSFPNLSAPEADNKIPNLATSIFNEVRNSFIKLPSETKPFLNLNMLENGFRDQSRMGSHNISCTICGIQLPGGESMLLDHLYSCHNHEKSSNQSPIQKFPPKKDSPMSSVTNGESYISPFDAFKSSMAAAKLADRVTCDICHKDLCNKYFLRTHKLKLHGIQTIDSTGRSGHRKEKTGIYEHCPSQFDQLNQSSNFLPTSSSTFHRNSIPNPVLAASLFQNAERPAPVSPENGGCFCPICKRLVSLPYFLPLHMWNVHGIGMGTPNSFLPTASVARPNIDSSALDHNFLPIGIQSKINQTLFPLQFGPNGIDTASMGSKWYRKSPNQMRVRCDICDKWICNKYFLRTHKLNKHGLTDSGSNTDMNSDTVSRGFFVDSSTTVPTTSNITIDSFINQNNNVPTNVTCCDSSPIDLSSSPIRENYIPKIQNQSISGLDKNLLPSFSCNSIMSNISLRSIWNTGIRMPWSLPLPSDRNYIHNTNSTGPLDLSVNQNNENKRVIGELDPTTHQSLVISAAKKLKIKYQKIYRSQLCKRMSQRNSLFLNQSPCSARINYSSSCPLCGKLLQDAPRFLQHLTQFHYMVLPGTHSGMTISSSQY